MDVQGVVPWDRALTPAQVRTPGSSAVADIGRWNRVLGILDRAAAALEAPDEATARRAGRLRFLAGLDDGIDALVAAAAVDDGSPAVVLTSDPEDLERLLARDPQVQVRTV